MTQRIHVRAIGPAAIDGHVLKTVGGVAEWVEDPPSALKLDDLTDVDTSTVPPAEGATLVWDSVAGFWKPVAPAAPTAPTRYLVPATTVESGAPTLLWNDADELVLVEVTS